MTTKLPILILFAAVILCAQVAAEDDFGRVSAVIIHGSFQLEQRELERAVGLRGGMRLEADSLPEAERRLRDLLEREGYREARIQLERRVTPLKNYFDVIVHIAEGKQATIGRIDIEAPLSDELRALVLRAGESYQGEPATRENVRELQRSVLHALREAGYLQAAVRVTRESFSGSEKKLTIQLAIRPRDRVRFVFSGNSVFSDGELFALLGLEERVVPFTDSALQLLCVSITERYQQEGYFFATAQCRSERLETGEKLFAVLIEEGKRVTLRRIIFRGGTAFPEDRLRELMVTRERSLWSRQSGRIVNQELAFDLEALEELYEVEGYLGTQINSQLEFSADQSTAVLTVVIVEAPRQTIEAIEVQGFDSALTLRLEAGAPLSPSVIEEERVRVQQEVANRGYPRASVTVSVEQERRRVTFVIETGPQITVGDIEVEGNEWTEEAVIRRELSVAKGAPWSPAEMERSENSLSRTGLFREIALLPRDGVLDSSEEALLVRVQELQSSTVQSRVSYNTEDGLHLAGELKQRNLNGTGNMLSLRADGYIKADSDPLDATRARLLFVDRKVADTTADFFAEVFAQYSLQTVEQFSSSRLGASSSLKWDLGAAAHISIGWTGFEERVFDVEEEAILGPNDQGSMFYSIFGGALEYDQRDDEFNPRKGYLLSLEPKIAARYLGSEAEFTGLSTQAAYYLPLSPRLTWSNGFRALALWPLGDSEVIPISQRIFLGGRNSLRGFRRNSIGPRASDGTVVGGDLGTVYNTELQYDISEGLAIALFLDVGQAFLMEKGSFTADPWRDVRFSPGLGARYKTPIGPLSIDFGFALDREYGEKFGRLSFGIGGAF